jgi:hypothetical protein
MQFIDEGQWEGIRLFQTEAQVALQLMQSLSPELQEQVRIYKKMHDPAMPEERWHPADEVCPPKSSMLISRDISAGLSMITESFRLKDSKPHI